MSPNEIVIDAILLVILLVGAFSFIRTVRRHWRDAGEKIDEFLRRDNP